MKQVLLILIVVTLSAKSLFSQINLKKNTDSISLKNNAEIDNDIRCIFPFLSIGVIEYISFGLGYQVTENSSISLKRSSTWIGTGAMGFPNSASGYGIKLAYYIPILIFNAFSFEYILYTKSTLDWERKKLYSEIKEIPVFKGHYFDFNLGRETINKSGFNFFWGIGFCISAAKEAHTIYSPSLKMGLTYNFIRKKEWLKWKRYF